MKKFILLPLLLTILASATFIPKKESLPTAVTATNENEFNEISNITFNDFLKLTPSTIKEITGEKLNTKERLVLSLMQKEIKRGIRKNEISGDTSVDFNQYFEEGISRFNFGGFVLGLLLGLIGVLFAHIFSTNKDFRRSAWQGWGVWLIILLILLFV
jgi:hypothetical protein